MQQRWLIFLFSILTVLSGTARADIVHLKGGFQVEGKVVKKEKYRVLLETLTGIQSIPRVRIVKIVRRPWDVEVFRKRLSRETKRCNAKSVLKFYDWACHPDREKKLETLLPSLYKLVVAVIPDHTECRKRLGQVRLGDRWIGQDEADNLAELEKERAAKFKTGETKKRTAAERAKHDQLNRRAAKFGGYLPEEQIGGEAKRDLHDGVLLGRVLGFPQVTVLSSKRISVQGFVSRREAEKLLLLGEQALAIWGKDLYGQVYLNPFRGHRFKFIYYAVRRKDLPGMVNFVAKIHGGVSRLDRWFYANYGLGFPPHGWDHFCVRPLDLDPLGLEESFLLALARAWGEAASGSRLMPWMPEGFAREAVRRVMGYSPMVRSSFCLDGMPSAIADGVDYNWLAHTLGRLKKDPDLETIYIKSEQELTFFDIAKATGIVAMLWETHPRKLGFFIRSLGYKHNTQPRAIKESFDRKPDYLDRCYRDWAVGRLSEMKRRK